MSKRIVGKHLAALVVPFTEDDRLDEVAFRSICRHVGSIKGIDGLIVNAHAGEVDSLTYEERIQVAGIASEEAHSLGKRLVAGVSPYPDTNQGAIQTALDSQEVGADAILLIGPRWFTWGIQHVPEVVYSYVSDVASSVKIPVLFFVVGEYTGMSFTPEMVRQICSIDNVVGIKDTSWSTHGFEANLKILRKLEKHLDILTGNDTLLLYNFLAGADGTLLILHCIVGRYIIEMFDAVAEGNMPRAVGLNHKMEPLIELLFAPPMIKMPSRMKEALYYLGLIPNTRVRPPIPRIEEEERIHLIRAMKNSGLFELCENGIKS